MRLVYLVLTLTLLAVVSTALSSLPRSRPLPVGETKLVPYPPFEAQEVHVERVTDVRFTGDRRLEVDAPRLLTTWRSLDALGEPRTVVVTTERWPEDTDVSWKHRHARLAAAVMARYPNPTPPRGPIKRSRR